MKMRRKLRSSIWQMLLLFLVAALAAAPAGAQSTRAALTTQNNNTIGANGIGSVTGPKLNTVIGAGIQSYGTLLDPQTWAATQTFTLAPIFTPLTGYLKGNGASALTAAATVPLGDLSGLGTGEPAALAINSNASGGHALVNGAISNGDCLVWSATGIQDNGAACATVTNSGNLTLNSIVLGTGTTGIKVVPGLFSDGTSILTLGQAGTSVGGLALANATSGTITLSAPTGALGSVTVTVPDATDTLVNLNGVQTLTQKTLTSPTINTATIAGGSVNNATIGNSTPNTGAFTTLTASSTVTLSPASAAVTISPSGTGTVAISPVGALTINPTAVSTINNTSIGQSTALAGTFTSLTATAAVALSPASANVVLSPTGTGVVTVNPATAGTLNNVSIGQSTALAGTFTTLTATGTVSLSPANLNVTISPTGTGTVAISPAGALTINPTAASTINNASIGATTASTGKFTTVTATNLVGSTTAPTVTGFCSSPSVPAANGTWAFSIAVGTACAASTGTITLPAATNNWVCDAHDITTPASNIVEMSSGTATTVVLTNYARTTGVAANFTSSDTLRVKCTAF